MAEVLRNFPGYTVGSLLDEDAHELMLLRDILGAEFGRA